MLKQLSIAAALAAAAVAQNTPSLADALKSSSELSTLAGLVPQDVLQSLSSASNITILAPGNSAFEKVSPQLLSSLTSNQGAITALLQYHVLNGSYPSSAIPDEGAFVPTLLTNSSYTNVTGGQVVHATTEDDKVVFYTGSLSNSTVTTANVNFTGGVIHIIDTLLTIPGSVSDIATAAGLTSVRGALVSANLVQTVDTTPDVTIFAPTNQAFQNIGSALPGLSADDLTKILTYHVIAGTVGYSTRLANGTSIATVNGANVTITVNDDGIYVNNAEVVIADVLVANGVVHVIDQVLNPNNTTVSDSEDGVPAYSGATPVSNAPFTSGQPTPSAPIGGGAGAGNGTRPTGTGTPTGSGLPQATANAAPAVAVSGGFAALFAAAAFFL
ncbi:hypothetical protein COCCADRAFT_5663 [Bipolaris zeicola 26-R-13]|uniref:FAS1 domain-containing protein n=1 Tax=Cochliobolus carbonum (strain 26-R-13) TaxID=930089 RepID=W6XZ03_COCC2|nr:uncharacterized protein COCCADRAFT_5663 [Bipolaris zeicola 26-R-13]EUC32672.1 hypothetical protein COCCADRAFT_5663 [Bipolaris zeicola 26-R-13]